MRRSLLIAALVSVPAGVIFCTRAENVSTHPAAAVATESNLDQPLGELRIDMPLEKALDRLQGLTRANIVVDWPALEAAGCRRDAPVRLHVFDLPLRKVLDLILIDACSEQGGRLSFRVDDENERIFYVSTRDALAGTAVTRLYDVRDLVEGFFPTVTGGDGKPLPALTPDERIEALSVVLRDNVAADSWRNNGGLIGRMRAVAGFLIIVQTPENHRAIELILYNLRGISAGRKAGEKPTTRGIDLLAPPAAEPGKK